MWWIFRRHLSARRQLFAGEGEGLLFVRLIDCDCTIDNMNGDRGRLSGRHLSRLKRIARGLNLFAATEQGQDEETLHGESRLESQA